MRGCKTPLSRRVEAPPARDGTPASDADALEEAFAGAHGAIQQRCITLAVRNRCIEQRLALLDDAPMQLRERYATASGRDAITEVQGLRYDVGDLHWERQQGWEEVGPEHTELHAAPPVALGREETQEPLGHFQ